MFFSSVYRLYTNTDHMQGHKQVSRIKGFKSYKVNSDHIELNCKSITVFGTKPNPHHLLLSGTWFAPRINPISSLFNWGNWGSERRHDFFGVSQVLNKYALDWWAKRNNIAQLFYYQWKTQPWAHHTCNPSRGPLGQLDLPSPDTWHFPSPLITDGPVLILSPGCVKSSSLELCRWHLVTEWIDVFSKEIFPPRRTGPSSGPLRWVIRGVDQSKVSRVRSSGVSSKAAESSAAHCTELGAPDVLQVWLLTFPTLDASDYLPLPLPPSAFNPKTGRIRKLAFSPLVIWS